MKEEVKMNCEETTSEKISGARINHNEFVKLWNAGVSGREIARIMRISESRISTYAKKHSDECPQRTKRNKINHEKFVEMWAAGASIKEISDFFGICEVYVSEYSKEHRASCPTRKPRTQINHDEFSRLWNLGMSGRDIAKELGISEMSVSKYAKLHKDEFPRRWKRNRIDHDKFVKMWNEGETIKIIAETFKISEAFVAVYLNEHRDECPKRNGNIHRSSKRKISHEEFVKLWNTGYSLAEIAEKLGITPKYASKYAANHRDLCPCKRPTGRKYRVNHSKFVALWNSNCSLDEIAEAFEITKKAASHYASIHRKECPARKRGSKKHVN